MLLPAVCPLALPEACLLYTSIPSSIHSKGNLEDNPAYHTIPIKYPRPVSYTHLEAGKQELYLKQRPDELEKLVEIAKIQSTEASNAIEGIVTTNTRPVSYTHLDVYKRQPEAGGGSRGSVRQVRKAFQSHLKGQ